MRLAFLPFLFLLAACETSPVETAFVESRDVRPADVRSINTVAIAMISARPAEANNVFTNRGELVSALNVFESELVNANAKQVLTDVMESAPDAFVVTDLGGNVLTANRAFLQLAQVSNEALVRGESLERWLGRAGVDLSVLISNLRQRDVVRLFATRMRGDYGSTTDVEISAVAVTTGEQRCLGFTIRDVGLRLNNEAKPGRELPRSTG
ncbi:MAG: PAS domain S-box protein, partial [Alphaproteobacteria bacterium]|nr:PAS domain S-box protein [Alphaproteobacteria bacterium]